MSCGCRQSYIVNPSGNKKDNSFKLFIAFLLAVLLAYLVIYALILVLTKNKNNGEKKESEEFTTKLPIDESSTIFYLLYQKSRNRTESSTEKFIKSSTFEHSKELYTTRAENAPQINLYTTRTENASQTNTEGFTDEAAIVTNSWPLIKTEPEPATTEKDNKSSTSTTTNVDFVESTHKQTETSTEIITQTNRESIKDSSILIAEKYIIESTLAATNFSLATATEKAIIVANTEKSIIEDTVVTRKICETSSCKKMAVDVMKKLDFFIDPCEDFYGFTCSNDAMENVEDFEVFFREIKSNSNGNEGLKSFVKFFNSCEAFRNEYGSFDKIQKVLSINIRSSNLTTLLAFLLLRQSTPLFEIVQGKNGEIQILPPSSYDTDILENWSINTHIQKYCLSSLNLEEYKQCQNNTLYKMLNNLHSFKTKENKVKDTPDFDFMLNIMKNQIPIIDIQEALILSKSCENIDIQQLNKDYPIIDWKILLTTLTETSNSSICIYFKKEYFDSIMTDLSVRMTKNESQVLKAIKEYFQLQLYENLLPQQNDKFYCMKQAIKLMPEIAEKLLQQHVSNNDTQRFNKMFEEVKDKFYWLIEISKLKEDDKNLFKNKLKLLKMQFNDKIGNKFAEDNHAYFTDDYLTNLFMLLEDRRIIRTKGLMKGKIDLIDDTIIIPYSFVYETKIKKLMPDFYIKFYMGRVVAQYFNQVARDEKNSFYKEFQKKLNENLENNFQQQLSSKLVLVSTFERTADNLALRIAFDSYFPRNVSTEILPWISEEYTDEQQFFLNIGEDFCDSSSPRLQILEETKNLPSKFRMEAMLTNSNNFAKSFNCPQGSQMNPADEKIEFDQFQLDDEYEFGDPAYQNE